MQECAALAGASDETRSAADREDRKNATERASGPSLDGQLACRYQAGDAEGGRRPQHRGAVRTDPREPPVKAAPQAAPAVEFRGGVETPSRLASLQERELREESELPGRGLLAALRAGGGGRNRRPHGILDAGLGLAPIGPWAQSGLVRICQPAGRTAGHGGGAASSL